MQQDTSGWIKQLLENMGLPIKVASAKLVDIIDNSTREGEGG
jgi:hypothetical protein